MRYVILFPRHWRVTCWRWGAAVSMTALIRNNGTLVRNWTTVLRLRSLPPQ